MPITRHAYKRARERYGIGKLALERLTEKALDEGEYRESEKGICITHSGRMFIFKDGRLVTIIKRKMKRETNAKDI